MEEHLTWDNILGLCFPPQNCINLNIQHTANDIFEQHTDDRAEGSVRISDRHKLNQTECE